MKALPLSIQYKIRFDCIFTGPTLEMTHTDNLKVVLWGENYNQRHNTQKEHVYECDSQPEPWAGLLCAEELTRTEQPWIHALSSQATRRNLFLILFSLLTHCHWGALLPSNKTQAGVFPIFCQGEAPPLFVPRGMIERSLYSCLVRQSKDCLFWKL